MAQDLVFTAISNITSLYEDEVHLFRSVKTEREKLESHLFIIHSVLEDAEKKQLAKTSDALSNWLQKLKDVVYELDDILDDCLTESIRDEYEGDRSCAFLGFLHPQKVNFRHCLSKRMKAVRERLDFIAQEKDQFNFLPAESQPDAHHGNLPQWRQTSSFTTEDGIFGREKDKEIIVRHLLEGASHGDTLNVYPIVGIGGLGKTALAQLVYHDERVTKHFDLKKWVCVSENFDLGILIKAITESNESPGQLDLSIKKLQGILQAKRYLIVLDDVWNEDLDKWMQWRRLLACGSRNSAVLITTRLEKVATIMKAPSAQPYRLTALSEDDCWQVFRKRAFGLSVVEETQNLVRIGKQITRKCKGVPLAAKTLGGLLSLETNERSWHIVRDSELWNLPEEQGSIMAALRLSYLNLSPRTRRCFSFCSIFPKDHEISEMNLIHLWMANGIISEGPSTTVELEDIGKMVVNDLYWRSLIQDIKRDDDSTSIISFKMHDLVHDLAKSISSHESDILEGSSSADLSPGTRHVSIAYYGNETRNMCDLLEKFQSPRSLVFLRCIDPVALATSCSLKHTRLRALDWSGLSDEVQILPSSLSALKHLRYLNLTFCKITELPDSICSLWNLQTLNVSRCRELKTFPVSIGRLKNLRHLCNGWCSSLSGMPQSIGGLISLRTLTFVVVGEYQKKEFQLSGLEHLKYLRGELTIEHLERVRDVKDVEKAKLMEKHDLHDLHLNWLCTEDGSGGDNDLQEQIHILEALRPSPRLRCLKLFGYKGIHFSNWMMNEIASFTYIRSLRLSDCKSCTQLPPLWRLPSLKTLDLFDLPSLRCLIEIHEDSCGEKCVSFPSLEVLNISYLSRFEKIISGKEAYQELNNKNCTIFPCLSKLSISHCPKLKSFNSGPLPSLKKLVLDCLSSMRYLIESCVDSYGEEYFSFPLLESLSIYYLPYLEKIIYGEKPDQELNNKNWIMFPRLSKLFI